MGLSLDIFEDIINSVVFLINNERFISKNFNLIFFSFSIFLLNYMFLTYIVLFHPFFCALFNSFIVYPYPLTPFKVLEIPLNYFAGISSTQPILESIAMILSFEDLYWFHFSYFFYFFTVNSGIIFHWMSLASYIISLEMLSQVNTLCFQIFSLGREFWTPSISGFYVLIRAIYLGENLRILKLLKNYCVVHLTLLTIVRYTLYVFIVIARN